MIMLNKSNQNNKVKIVLNKLKIALRNNLKIA